MSIRLGFFRENWKIGVFHAKGVILCERGRDLQAFFAVIRGFRPVCIDIDRVC